MGSMSIMHWGVVLVIVMLLFGTKKLSSAGSDLGKAIKGFKDGVNGADEVTTKAVGSSTTSAAASAQSDDKRPNGESA